MFERELCKTLREELRAQPNSGYFLAEATDPNWDDIDLAYGQFYWVVGRSPRGSVYYIPDVCTVYSAHPKLFDIDEARYESLPVVSLDARVDPGSYRELRKRKPPPANLNES